MFSLYITGMLYEGEIILNKGTWLEYQFVSFFDEYSNIVVKPPMTAGRACITDKRVMFLSAQNAAGKWYLNFVFHQFSAK